MTMRPLEFAAALVAAVSLSGPTPAMAQSQIQCGPAEAVLAVLQSRFGETAVAAGTAANGNELIVTASSAGTWTIVLVRPPGLALGSEAQGQACLLADGEGFRLLGPPPVDRGPPGPGPQGGI